MLACVPDVEPPAWSWEEYEAWLLTEWGQCLKVHHNDEGGVHRFLEQHPCLLPGGEADANSIGGHHGPFPGVVVSKAPLQGTFRRHPDFIWPTKVSGVFRPVLLELEKPSKRWFRQDGQQTEELSQAITQIAEWRTWLDSDANRLLFYEAYGISDWIRAYHKIEPVYRLVYGRRREFRDNAKLTRQRESVRPTWLGWSTYDRLHPAANARRWLSVKVTTAGWEVIGVPPTYSIPNDWEADLQGLIGLDDAIAGNALMSDARKDFLLERLSRLSLKPAAPPNLWEVVLRDLKEPDDYEPPEPDDYEPPEPDDYEPPEPDDYDGG